MHPQSFFENRKYNKLTKEDALKVERIKKLMHVGIKYKALKYFQECFKSPPLEALQS